MSTSVALARRAPTVACYSGMCANGSQCRNRQAFCHVILSMSESLAPTAFNSLRTNSGASGHS